MKENFAAVTPRFRWRQLQRQRGGYDAKGRGANYQSKRQRAGLELVTDNYMGNNLSSPVIAHTAQPFSI